MNSTPPRRHARWGPQPGPAWASPYDQIGPLLALIAADDIALIRLGSRLFRRVLERPGAVRREIDATLERECVDQAAGMGGAAKGRAVGTEGGDTIK